jgi:DNA topoisomerase-2
MYIGSIDEDTYNTWVFDEENKRMIKKDISIVPGLYKIFDEILVNAVDHAARLKQQKEKDPLVQLVKNIKINIEKLTGLITITNDGDGIEVEKHPEHDMYVPELIFGNLLTSTNYDDTEEKVIGGQNGIGAKACNIFSAKFTLETVDSRRKKIYHQEFSKNMSCKTTPVVKYCTKKPYTTISFLPDFQKFKMQGLSEDMYSLFMKRSYDVCAVTENEVSVWVNDTKLEFKNFEKYVDLYLGPKANNTRVYERINDRWEIVVATTESVGFEQVSFVNGIWTIRGGKHVDYITNQVANQLCEMINKKRKGVELKPQHIKNYMVVFVRSTITNPTFDSQTKDFLTTIVSKFGSKAEVTEKFIEKLYKTEIVTKALALSEVNVQKSLKKTDGKKSTKIRGLIKLDDANWAGTSKSKECILILTEGDSAKSMALCGLSEVGRDRYGIFPLRGKLLNVKDATPKKLMENEEIQNIKKIIGLESGKTYTSIDDLRYGRIMIMSDQDHDGSHIRGLIMNLFQTLWPSLFRTPTFVTSLLTPIVKVINRSAKNVVSFYNMTEYDAWMKDNNMGMGWDIKYYKGLGTSTEKEAKDYFRNMHRVVYDHTHTCDEKVDLAFNKKRADDRKKWLSAYDPNTSLSYNNEEEHVTYDEFINKELIHFSIYDIKRSIPSMVDGLKPSQRKILYACFKRNLMKEVKVSQLSAYVSENAAYHHGEASLQAAIICMAQDFVGSNNINLLKPNGQFGSRVMGGKDAAASRYIFTELDPIVMDIFKKDDANVLSYLEDDGYKVEPEYYVPIIPMALINACIGIGTGFSTSVPSYNPIDVIICMRHVISNDGGIQDNAIPVIKPWYRGFEGKVVPVDERSSAYTSHGCYRVISDKTIEVTELPIGVWTEDYKSFLEEYMEKNPKVLKDYESHYTTQKVRFLLHFAPDELSKLSADNMLFEKEFKLVNKAITTTNMHLFDENGIIKKYGSVHDIINDFYHVRLRTYVQRKQLKIEELEALITKISAKAKFILDVCNGTIEVMKKSKTEVEEQLVSQGFPSYQDGFNYLINMPIYNLTREKQESLMKELVDLEVELDRYMSTSVKEIWLGELDDLEVKLNKYNERHVLMMNEEQKNGNTKNTNTGRKSVTKRPPAQKK